MKHFCPSETGHGKPCKNGSHFIHDGGVHSPTEKRAWTSFTVRDQYGCEKGARRFIEIKPK